MHIPPVSAFLNVYFYLIGFAAFGQRKFYIRKAPLTAGLE